MTKTIEIDRRILRRRREVAEGRTRSNLGRLGLLFLFALFVGLIVWVFRSPLFEVAEISVAGALPTMTAEIQATSGIALGQPLITVRPGEVEANLAADPRILSSEVTLAWPDQVVIDVVPRLPVAWIADSGQWSLVGIDGVVLRTSGQPGSAMPRVNVDPTHQSLLLGGLEFAAHLDPLLLAGATVDLRGEELWGFVGGYEVRLGRAVDMAAKARALNTLLRQTLPPGAVINLIAPSRPALLTPGS